MKWSAVTRGKGRPEAYKVADGTRVPSWSSISGNRKSGAEPLMIWSYNCGYEDGRTGAPQDPKSRRDAAAQAGTIAHAMVENSIHQLDPMESIPPVADEILTRAAMGYKAWHDWSQVMKVEYLMTEVPMVSEKHRYGGTPDAFGRIDGKLALLDWKTSNHVYGDYVIQLAAYKQLWEENRPDQPIDLCYLLRFGKEMGDFHVHAYPASVMEMGWTAFLHLLDLYILDKQLKKVST